MILTGDRVYDGVLFVGFAIAILTAITTLFMQPPYGRFGSRRTGLNLDPRLGWFLMELPATISFLYFFSLGPRALEAVPLLFLVIWIIHYANRGFLFPYLMRVPKGSRKTFGLGVVVSGWIVTTIHGYLNGTFFSAEGTHLTGAWLTDPRFIGGILLYYSGFILNIHSDAVLRNLRDLNELDSEEAKYRIPYGGAYRFVSCPSYLGELMAWTGFAIFTWSFGGLFILAISLANLVPRALATHRWYHERFDNYPKDRKALIPFAI